MPVHGYPDDMWGRAKDEARTALVRVARGREVIAYSDLTPRVQSISFLPTDQRFLFLLREISTDEYRAGRGMLTAVVVHKVGDYKPGPGFFELARGLGLDTSSTPGHDAMGRAAISTWRISAVDSGTTSSRKCSGFDAVVNLCHTRYLTTMRRSMTTKMRYET